jgi:hypothetical protein
LHAPEPLHVPVWQLDVMQAESAVPADLLAQVPADPRLQAWQAPQLLVEQQVPSTQFPEAHSVPVLHVLPSGFPDWHLPPLQYGVGARQPESAAQLVMHVAPEQA